MNIRRFAGYCTMNRHWITSDYSGRVSSMLITLLITCSLVGFVFGQNLGQSFATHRPVAAAHLTPPVQVTGHAGAAVPPIQTGASQPAAPLQVVPLVSHPSHTSKPHGDKHDHEGGDGGD